MHQAPDAGAPWVGEGRAAAEQGLAQAVGGWGRKPWGARGRKWHVDASPKTQPVIVLRERLPKGCNGDLGKGTSLSHFPTK